MPSIRIRATTALRFDSGEPVRAASAVAALGDGWLIAQDDETIGAWWRGNAVTPIRLFPPVDGHDTFSEDEETKHLKPDLEAACPVKVDGGPAVLLLGSGSLPRRMRGALVSEDGDGCRVTTAHLDVLYARMAATLELNAEDLNLEGACVVGDRLRWFQRGHGVSDVPSSSVDVDLAALLDAVKGATDPREVELRDVRRYEFESSGDVALAITDAGALSDGRILVSVAAEDAPDAVQDGEVVGSALAVLVDDTVVDVLHLPKADDGSVYKVEGLAVRKDDGGRLDLLAVVDQDDPKTPSLALDLEVELPE